MRTTSSSSDAPRLSTADVRRAFEDSPIATLFRDRASGSGLSPFAPGTAGSALGLVAAWLLFTGCDHAAECDGSGRTLDVRALVGLAGVPPSTRTARVLGEKDPGCIVIDEIAGQILACAAVPLFRYPTLRLEALAWLASFFLFRLFDVWKPGPIRAPPGPAGGVGNRRR